MKIYQMSDGTYLPMSSQPADTNTYEMQGTKYTPHKSTRYVNIVVGTNGIPQRKNKEGQLVDSEKGLPELYENRENCCGCTACYAICPVGAIVMRPDEEGFLYPVVDAEKCIRCYKCLSVCAFKEAQRKE